MEAATGKYFSIIFTEIPIAFMRTVGLLAPRREKQPSLLEMLLASNCKSKKKKQSDLLLSGVYGDWVCF